MWPSVGYAISSALCLFLLFLSIRNRTILQLYLLLSLPKSRVGLLLVSGDFSLLLDRYQKGLKNNGHLLT